MRSGLEGQKRTDFAANYTYISALARRTFELFVQAQVINLFNQFQLCGCGRQRVRQPGRWQRRRPQHRSTHRIRRSTPRRLYAPFNPFTTTPVEGVNWDYGRELRQGG